MQGNPTPQWSNIGTIPTLLGNLGNLSATGLIEHTGSGVVSTLATTTIGRNMLAVATPGATHYIRVTSAGAVETLATTDFRNAIGAGTVTSVQASGGSTGLTFTGGPITGSGTLTIGGTLAVAFGGTGATNTSGARTNLGLGTIATQNSNAVSITGGTIAGLTSITVPTATVGTNTTAAASTAFVQSEVNSTAFAEWVLNNYSLSMTTGVILDPTLIPPTVYAGSGFSTSGFTVPSGQGGLYYVEVYGEVVGSANNIAYAQVGLKKNSIDFFRRQQINFAADSFLAFIQTLSTMIFLADGDVIRPQFTAAFTSGTVTLQNASFLVHKMNSY